ncbi:RagB/SusD family nutrient uptake outer membrane protein [Mucilaginibacter gilvus]|uniref:RagB/SusD family nutrient uptake outer membrane protein n=1 Tax=Mucilaginibacter gilvus TaxID=2305909 RepID=A0A444MPL2_9SPHI|nr:RagB/SusD family nutrient uptake outer membrane protein [Mucilaginibacter gilvus]RWY52592.1 RagB/SusD family nutrient uptake outer membrane protein [Mucilaginibacter gilvus]
MRNFKYLMITLGTVALLGTSCQKQIDIKPQNSVESDLALKTSKDVQGVLIGAYTAAAARGLYGGRFQVTSDFLGDDGDFGYFGTFFGYTELNNKTITVDNSFTEGVWNAGYNTIGVCNTVLAHLDLVDAANKARVEGEAKFLRGMTYFDLARLFGKAWNDGSPASNLAVPLVLTPTTAIVDIQKPTRNTVAEIYAQAITDLKVAETNLGIKSTYASSAAASAVLARIYLTQEKYDLADAEATKIISSGEYALVEHFVDEFQVKEQATRVFNTSEDIFAIQISNQSGFNALNEAYASSTYAGREETYLFNQFFDSYEDGDDRVNEQTDDSFTSKFNNAFGNVVVIRLAEIYLIRAEARIKKASPDLAGAADDINVTRHRALLDNTTATTAEDLFDAVKYERRAELKFEGFRLFDLKRYKESTYSVDGDGNHVDEFVWNSPKLVFPIPKRERDANPSLTQNEGYQ